MSSMSRPRRILLAVLALLAAGALAGTGAATANADPIPGADADRSASPAKGSRIPATELPEAACGVPATADDAVLVTLKQVADQRQVSAKVRLAMFETAWVESHANNLNCGDRDSVGVFQQRPSAGWGTVDQLLDVEYAANKFLDGNGAPGAVLVADRNPTWTAGQVSQEVQVSAFPDRYDESQATAESLMARAAELDSGAPSTEFAWPVISEGDNSTKTRVAQLLLNQSGASLEADGAFGPLTTAAVSDFQSANGLGADGVIGSETWAALVVGASEGDSGPVTEAVQYELNAEGFPVAVDGAYGPATADAVGAVRSYYGLPAGQSVDAATWQALLH